jgi:divalent metal cation (Fe/Co/Zn/Cd) transporter
MCFTQAEELIEELREVNRNLAAIAAALQPQTVEIKTHMSVPTTMTDAEVQDVAERVTQILARQVWG